MFRSLIFLFLLCAMFLACSSDDSASLKDWFSDQGMAASYEPDYFEMEIPVESVVAGFDSSAYIVQSFAALGNANGVEHTIYFGLVARASSAKKEWILKIDSVFYEKFPLPTDGVSAKFYWLTEGIKPDSLEPDSSWLKLGKAWKDSADARLNWHADSSFFTMELPEKFLDAYPKQDSSIMLAGLKLENDMVLRIAPPPAVPNDIYIEGLRRVAQKSRELEPCETCLYAGVNDSIVISFDINGVPKKTVVFAQLVIPKTGEIESEFNNPLPLYANNEAYRIDTAYVQEHGHPNLLWKGKGDALEVQVTRGMRNDSSSFTFRFGNPMLTPNSLRFYNLTQQDSVFALRPDYAKYDFKDLENATLKLWLAKYKKEDSTAKKRYKSFKSR